jgi:hypothetical protein
VSPAASLSCVQYVLLVRVESERDPFDRSTPHCRGADTVLRQCLSTRSSDDGLPKTSLSKKKETGHFSSQAKQNEHGGQ